LRQHRELVLNYFRTQKSLFNGVVEGLNNKAKVTMRKSYCPDEPDRRLSNDDGSRLHASEGTATNPSDGQWPLQNGTRTEIMVRKPVQKPCCSENVDPYIK